MVKLIKYWFAVPISLSLFSFFWYVSRYILSLQFADFKYVSNAVYVILHSSYHLERFNWDAIFHRIHSHLSFLFSIHCVFPLTLFLMYSEWTLTARTSGISNGINAVIISSLHLKFIRPWHQFHFLTDRISKKYSVVIFNLSQ